jgi:hypothetical protein
MGSYKIMYNCPLLRSASTNPGFSRIAGKVFFLDIPFYGSRPGSAGGRENLMFPIKMDSNNYRVDTQAYGQQSVIPF